MTLSREPVLWCSWPSLLHTDMGNLGDFYFLAQLHSLDLKLWSIYNIFCFRNYIKLLKKKPGFKCSYPEVKDTNVMQITNIWQNKIYLHPYRTPACHVPLESSLCELCCQMCIGKIKLGQSSQTRQHSVYNLECWPITCVDTHSQNTKST